MKNMTKQNHHFPHTEGAKRITITINPLRMCVIISEMDFTLFVDIIEKWRPQKIQLINLINCSSQKIMKLSLFNISLLLSSVNKSRPIITLTLPIRVMKPASRNLSFVTSIISINSYHQVNLYQLHSLIFVKNGYILRICFISVICNLL